MQIVRLLIIFISLTVLSSAAYAGNRAGAATMTLGAGYDFFSSKRHIDNTGFPLLILGYDLTDHWGVEGLAARFSADSRRVEDNGKQINGTLFAFDGVYHFSFHKIEPFILAGVGIIGTNPNGTDANNQGNINAGIGAQFFFHKSIAFRLEARDFYTMPSNYNDIFVSGGVSFLLDLC